MKRPHTTANHLNVNINMNMSSGGGPNNSLSAAANSAINHQVTDYYRHGAHGPTGTFQSQRIRPMTQQQRQ